VLATPLSENAIVGVAGGLALCGDPVIVEIMFGDFAGLAFDQLLNFASKSVTMYGEHTPMRMVVRCPVGGGRGYGPTHSQSVQKHFVGIPNLALYELSPFHDAADVLAAAFATERPCLLFEDKVLYTLRMFRDGEIDDRFRFRFVGDGWAHAYSPGASGPRTLVICPGGMAHRALDAARCALDAGRDVRVLVPARLYPVPAEDLIPFVRDADEVLVAEEGTAGGTWGAEVATRLYDLAWPLLRRPVGLIHSADRVIPAAPHLERAMLVQAQDILDRILHAPRVPAGLPPGVRGAGVPAADGFPVTVPKLNSNDTAYVLVQWLAADGGTVAKGDPIALVETSKTVEELVAAQAGTLRTTLPAGSDCTPGDTIAHLVPADTAAPPPPPAPAPVPAPPPLPAPAPPPVRPAASAPAGASALPAVQRRIAQVVTESHREIPAAFTAVRVAMDRPLAHAQRLTAQTGAAVGLAELIITAVARLHPTHPLMFATLTASGDLLEPVRPVVGVTVDAGTGLYLPVIRDADKLPLDDVADQLVDLRMKALRGRLREDHLRGMNILVALNDAPGVVIAQPIIPPGVTCALSMPAVHNEVYLAADGTPRVRAVADLGLAYDHRLVNGAQASAFLRDLADALQRD
jgi:pyruvate/2-oxoglutarate/acetoin dehydrogenase E1 component/pyruvate/2-oxoglutarate dehydrogenase complex dihydrolipoamide acyltransferase (E2) component